MYNVYYVYSHFSVNLRLRGERRKESSSFCLSLQYGLKKETDTFSHILPVYLEWQKARGDCSWKMCSKAWQSGSRAEWGGNTIFSKRFFPLPRIHCFANFMSAKIHNLNLAQHCYCRRAGHATIVIAAELGTRQLLLPQSWARDNCYCRRAGSGHATIV